MGKTLGIHWAATTYGTWLHGDPRGSWRHGKLSGPDPYLEMESRRQMTADAVKLDAVERTIVANEIGQVLKERRHRVFAATVQAMHIHLVFAPLPEDLKIAVARLKRRTAVEVLARRREMADGSVVPRSLWTAGKFPVFVFDRQHLVNAIEYVRAHNRRVGLPEDPHDWISPPFECSRSR